MNRVYQGLFVIAVVSFFLSGCSGATPVTGDVSKLAGTVWYVNVEAPDAEKTLHLSFPDSGGTDPVGSWQEVRWVFDSDGSFHVVGNPDCFRLYPGDVGYDSSNPKAIIYPSIMTEEIFWSGTWVEGNGYVYLTTTHLPGNGLPNQVLSFVLDDARNSYDRDRATYTVNYAGIEFEIFEHGSTKQHVSLYSDLTVDDYYLGEYSKSVPMYNAAGAWNE